MTCTLFSFLPQNEAIYQKAVKDLIKEGKPRLVIDINDLRRWRADVAAECVLFVFSPFFVASVPVLTVILTTLFSFMRKPMDFFAPFQAALKSYALSVTSVPLKTNVGRISFVC